MRPWAAEVLGPVCSAIILNLRRPHMPAEYPFALLTDLRPLTKPTVFRDLDALARSILRRRGGQALQLRPDRIMVRDEPKPRSVVAIYGEDQFGGRLRFIGYAWIAGRDWTALHRAIDAIEPMLRAA